MGVWGFGWLFFVILCTFEIFHSKNILQRGRSGCKMSIHGSYFWRTDSKILNQMVANKISTCWRSLERPTDTRLREDSERRSSCKDSAFHSSTAGIGEPWGLAEDSILFCLSCLSHPPAPSHTQPKALQRFGVLYSVKAAGGPPSFQSRAKTACVLHTWFPQSVARGSTASVVRLWTPAAISWGRVLEQVTGLASLCLCWNLFPPSSLSSPHFSGQLEKALSGFWLLQMTVRVIEFRLLLLFALTKITEERNCKCYLLKICMLGGWGKYREKNYELMFLYILPQWVCCSWKYSFFWRKKKSCIHKDVSFDE